ncbi:UDP-glycosyltransferase 76F1-like isoform X2 [Rhodamnia argentea]|uniref:UDP-glycosyltransferase 76F1-like isoform X2 n=1 Tax=Rhodamnia argentea TaxID=178133 RepID=A0A8B8PKB5_9MYRT|nr:UDP-glycosyltransferase 76F1-like isoform X2 [Rhodamnia argentea]
MNQRNNRRLVLFPVPFQGHINPMLQLAQILHNRGFSITILHTDLNAPDPSSHPHFAFRSIGDGLGQSEVSTSDLVRLMALINARCAAPFEERLREEASSPDTPITCLIVDALFGFTRDVAERAGVRRMVLRTGGATSLRVFARFRLLRERGYLPIEECRLEDPVAEFPPLQVKDLPGINTAEPKQLDQLLSDMIEGLRDSAGVILNTFEDLEQPALSLLRQEYPIAIFPIGPFHKCSSSSSGSLLAEDQSCISWLDKQAPNSVVYVSFGSIAAVSESEYSEIALGLADSQQPFLWVVRPGSVHGSEALEKLPSCFLAALEERGKIVTWAPQQEVLAHRAVGAFWTHNGWNSTLESISEGVPMICMPCFSDQKVNARFVSDVWRVGLHLNNGLERRKIAEAIRKLLVEKEREEVRERAAQLKEKADSCLRQGGSSFRSLDGLANHILASESFVFGSNESSA